MELSLEVKRVNSAALGLTFSGFLGWQGRNFFVPLSLRESRASGRLALAVAR